MRKLEISDERFYEEYNKGLNDVQISKIFNCSSTSILNIRKNKNLAKNFKYPECISKEELEKLVKQGLSDYKIGDLLNINPSWIFELRKKWKLNRRNLKFSLPILLTKKQEEILIGHILGDGHLRNKDTNVSGKIEQGYKQKDYAEWKYNELKSLCNKFTYWIRGKADPRNGIKYQSYGTMLIANPELNKYYPLFYNNEGKKYISSGIMKLFTPLSLAVLFMDDGYKCQSSYSISTNCFDLNSIDLLQNKLSEFGLSTTIHKGNVIYIKACSRDLFTQLIKPYIIESMKYKLHCGLNE